jgi:ATP-dependent DNA helicase UvrD/PcrA
VRPHGGYPDTGGRIPVSPGNGGSGGHLPDGVIRYSPAHLARLLGLAEPTSEQAAVISAPLEPLAVIAGAGSGKSETMAARLVWLVANQMVRPEQVLGLTFTRKAAAELGQRVRARLDGLRRAGLPLPSGGVLGGAGGAGGGRDGAGRTGAGEAAAGVGGRGGGPVRGVPGQAPAALSGGLFDDWLYGDTPPAPLAGAGTPSTAGPLGEGARSAAGPGGDLRAASGPAGAGAAGAGSAVPAGAGGGDAARAGGGDPAGAGGGGPAGAWPPGAGETGAGEAGNEPLAPGDSPLDGEPVVSTYHAYAARLVADHALREAVEPSLRLVTPAVAWQIAARVVAAYPGPMDAVHWSPPEVTAAVLALAGEMAEHLRAPADVAATGRWLSDRAQLLPGRMPAKVRKILECQRTREQLVPIAAAYAEAKAAREVMDYGDQVALAARIATRHPEVGAIERARYQVVLLDEFQDTSHAQLVLLRALFGGGHPVTAVGDPCQSIYGWRGASAGNLRRFSHQFPAAARARPARGRGGASRPGEPRPASVAVLATSFRNTGRVLEVAAALQEGLREEAPEVPRLVPPPSRAARGSVTCALLETATTEADWIAERLAELLRLPAGTAPDGGPWPGHGADRVQPSDIAVLCRKRSQFALLRKAIEARGIPVEVVGLGGLLTIPEVADVVATLRVLYDPTASASLARLLTGPRWRIGPRDLVALGKRGRELAAEHRPGARAAPGGEAADALAEAVTDLTGDPGSLVEALDDLGNPAAYSPDAYARFSALAAELRGLRGRVGRALPDLVGEVERILGLDIEVAAQPWRDPGAARADLDAFADAAASFADDEEEPTLGAFLAYLAAAETEEFGLESGQPSGANAVTLTTVHAAKGLQWAAVVVPGLAAGAKSQVFPAKPRVTTRWTENPRLLPFGLRGDAGDLPSLADLSVEAVTAFSGACSDRELAEERRLAYVAVTRAAFWVACTGYWWGEGAAPLGPSVFLDEVRAACEAGAGTVAEWEPPPDEEADNPALAEPAAVTWPLAPSGPRHEGVREAAALVEQAIAERVLREDLISGRPGAGDGLTGSDRALARAWDRDASLLLAELAERRGDGGAAVPLPGRLSVSSLVTMAADPARLAQQIRRPMPRPPAPQARRGTAFHRWLEERFGQQRLIDPADLLGAADEEAEDGDAVELALLRDRFEAGEWADRWPVEVEVPFETLIAGRTVRGRIDAVFGRTGGGYEVVDWKTGEPPSSPEEFQAAAVQLAAYRLAWARLARVPVGQVRAGFYYVRHDLTLRPADLLGEAGLAQLIEGIPSPG